MDSANHAVVWAWDSTAFGLGNPTGSITFNLRFPGQYYDVGTNKFYNHNCYYNPELSRYMEADSIGLKGGLNPYAYAGSNPVMNTDSTDLILDILNNEGLSNTWVNNLNNQMWMEQQQRRFENWSVNGNRVSYYGTGTADYVKYNNQSYLAANYAISVGGNTTPIKGRGIDSGWYLTTGDGKAPLKELLDFGAFVTTSKLVGLSAGVGFSFDYWKGGRDNFDGNAKTDSVCLALLCGSRHVNQNDEFIGWGIAIGGDSGGSAAAGGSFTHAEDYTRSVTIRDFVKKWSKK
nr:RHS repeat-associated core domain-containing protein [Acinetobacter gyllenbergii]ESK55657.1 hypothetical protein F987_00532 [Acinetobacter gyllenbergii NIPH 230]